MVENYDLKTYSGPAGVEPQGTRTDLDIGAVPANMKRYITYLKINNILAASTFQMDESDEETGSTAAAGAVNTRKDLQRLATGDTIMYPDSPNAEHPIMSFDEGKFITMYDGTGNDTEVTFQYYDK